MDRQFFIPRGMYKNTIVAIKHLPVKQNMDKNIQFKRPQLIELKHVRRSRGIKCLNGILLYLYQFQLQMKDLSHDHLVKFYGICLDPLCVITEYCSKGSLQDILENEQFNMDDMINISLLQDIVRVSNR